MRDERYTSPETRTIQASGTYQISPRWQLTGNMFHDLQLKKLQNANAALNYTHACWNLHLESQWTNRPSGTSKASEFSFLLMVTFNGIGTFAFQQEGEQIRQTMRKL